MNLNIIYETFLTVLGAVPRTLAFALVIILLGILLGGLMALVRLRKIPVLTQIIQIFISYVRGVPLIVHLFIFRFGLPEAYSSLLGLFGVNYNRNNFPEIVTALVIYVLLEAAVESENIRGAFTSISPDQIEAGKSIGMTENQVLKRIIIPQALQVAFPLFLNSYVRNIKKLSLALYVGFVDILAQTRYAAALNYHYIESYIAAAIIYWLLTTLFQEVFDRVTKRVQFVAE